MANKAIIVVKNKGQLIPDATVEKIIAGHTAIGTAFLDENNELIVQKQAAPFALDTVKKYQDETKDIATVTIFQTMETPIDEANIQPFVEETEEENGGVTTHFAVFVEGDVSKYALPKQPQTAERQWFEKCFLPFLKSYSDFAGDKISIKGFMDYLSTMKSDVEKTIEGRGAIKIIAETGEILTFAKGNEQFSAEWGNTSSGYSEGKFPAEAETTKKVTSLFAKAKPKAEQPAATPPKEDKTIIHQPDPEKKGDAAVITPVAPQAPEGKVWARPIAMIRNNDKAMKKALNDRHGGCPKGWKHMEWFAIDKNKLPHKHWEVKDETAISSALTKAKNGDENKVTPEQMRQGLMPAQMQKDLKDKFLPSVAKYTETPNLPTMEELQADENKHPTWYDKTGIHVQDTLGWPPAKVEELDRDYHAAFVLRQKAIVSMLVKMMHEHPAKKEDTTEQETVPEKTGTTEDERRQNLANLNKDLTKTKTKSLFGGIRKSA